MQKRKLGYSDLNLSVLGLGTWAMGGYDWGGRDDKASVNSIHIALDQGINWIDTAAIYGLGHAEQIVGQAISEKRDSVIIATKCGRIWDAENKRTRKILKAKSIRAELEASLKRLKTEMIDLYQIHWPEPDEDIEEAWGAIAELIKEGKVRYGGVSNFSLEQIKRIQPIHPVASLQPPYNLFRRNIEEIFTYCAENRIGVITYSPLQGGLLTGKFSKDRIRNLASDDWRRRNEFFQEPQLSTNLNAIDRLKEIAQKKEITLTQLSIAWILRRPEVTAAIVGAREPKQIEKTARAGEIILLPEEVNQIEGVLHEREAALPRLTPSTGLRRNQ